MSRKKNQNGRLFGWIVVIHDNFGFDGSEPTTFYLVIVSLSLGNCGLLFVVELKLIQPLQCASFIISRTSSGCASKLMLTNSHVNHTTCPIEAN